MRGRTNFVVHDLLYSYLLHYMSHINIHLLHALRGTCHSSVLAQLHSLYLYFLKTRVRRAKVPLSSKLIHDRQGLQAFKMLMTCPCHETEPTEDGTELLCYNTRQPQMGIPITYPHFGI